MSLRLAPCCHASGKHKWEFIKNRTKVSYSSNAVGSSGSLRQVGVFKCIHCGQRKEGAYRAEWPQR
jgi:hypothetical protein